MSCRVHSFGSSYTLVFWLGALDLTTGDLLGCGRIALHSTIAGDCKNRLPLIGSAGPLDFLGVSFACGVGMAAIPAIFLR